MESAFCERGQIAGFRWVDCPSNAGADEACHHPFMNLCYALANLFGINPQPSSHNRTWAK